MMRGNNLCE